MDSLLLAATAVFTAVLAVVTWMLYRATDRMAAATRDPNIVATLEPSRWSVMHMELLVQNTGNGPAYDVRVVLDPPLEFDRRGDASELPSHPISVMRPGQVLRNYVAEGGPMLDHSFTAELSWKASPDAKKRRQASYKLHLAHYRRLVQLGGPDPEFQIAQELKKLREAVERIERVG